MPTKKDKSKEPRPLIVLTGMSGAGLSTALKNLEDLGYEAVDNLRLSLIPTWADGAQPDRPLAVAIDTRAVDFSVEAALILIEDLRRGGANDVRLVFLDCSDETLQRRFTETRRRHPLASERPVTDGIAMERLLIAPLQKRADHVIDTSALSIHDLRRLMAGHYRTDAERGLSIFVTSFSYRLGVPREADLVIDARFLKNPHWDKTLRPLTGLDEAVGAYIASDPDYAPTLERAAAFLLPLLPRYQQEGKMYLTIAVGCTGGKHRSVFVAEALATTLAAHGFVASVCHRDLEKTAPKA